MVCRLCPVHDRPFLSHVLAAIKLIFSKYVIQHVAVAPPKYQKRSTQLSFRSTPAHFCHTSLLMFTFQKYVSCVPWLSPHKSSILECPLLVALFLILCLTTFSWIFCFFGVSNFIGKFLDFIFAIFPLRKYYHCEVHQSFSLYLKIVFVVFPMEIRTCWCAHNLLVCATISVLSHVLANIHFFGALHWTS